MEVIKKLFEHTKLTYYELSNIVKDVINRDDTASLDWIISTNKISIKKHRLDIGNILDYAKHIGSIKIIDMLEHKYNLQPINPRFNTLTNIYVYLVNEHKIDISDDLLKNIVMEENIEAIRSLFEKCNKQQKETLLRYAIVDSKLDTVKYLVGECRLSISDDLLKNIVMEENIEAIKSLFEKCNEQQKTTLLRYAIVNGKLDAVKYLVEECKISISKNTIFEADTIEIIKYLIEESKIQLTKDDLDLGNAIHENDGMGFIKYLIEECKIQPTINNLKMALLVHSDYTITFIKYLIEECKIEPTEDILEQAVRVQYCFKFFEYLGEVKCINMEYSDYATAWINFAQRRGDVMQYIIEEYKMKPTENTSILINECQRWFNIIKYLIEENKMKLIDIEDLIMTITGSGDYPLSDFDTITQLVDICKIDPNKVFYEGYNIIGYITSFTHCFMPTQRTLLAVIHLIERHNMDPKEKIYGGHNLITHTMKFNKELANEILKYIIKKDFDIQLSSLIIE